MVEQKKLAKGGGSHGIQPTGTPLPQQTPKTFQLTPPQTPPTMLQQPRAGGRKAPPLPSGDRQSGRLPRRPAGSPRPIRRPLNPLAPPPRRQPDPRFDPIRSPFGCDPRASMTGRCAPPMPSGGQPKPIKRPPRFFPKKKPRGKFKMGDKPHKFKMGVPRKERIRLLKEEAARKAEEQKRRDGENFPVPPQDFNFPRPTVPQEDRRRFTRGGEPRKKGNPFGLDR